MPNLIKYIIIFLLFTSWSYVVALKPEIPPLAERNRLICNNMFNENQTLFNEIIATERECDDDKCWNKYNKLVTDFLSISDKLINKCFKGVNE